MRVQFFMSRMWRKCFGCGKRTREFMIEEADMIGVVRMYCRKCHYERRR